MKKVLLSLLLSLSASVSLAQSTEPLDELVAPFALYPDDLLALVLQASAYPLQVVEASRFIEDKKRKTGLQPDGSWDESIVALLNYPEIIDHLNNDLPRTEALGFAVIDREREVLDAIQAFRRRALQAGNLVSDDYQQVRVSDDAIEILTRTPTEVRIPYYEPAQVIVRQPRRVYHYYDYPRPVYYYPYPDRHYFSSGFFFGLTTAYSIGWLDHSRYIRHHNHRRHPYFGRPYSRNFFYYTRNDRDRRLHQQRQQRHDRHFRGEQRRDWRNDRQRDGRRVDRRDQRRDERRDRRRDVLRGDRKPQVVIDRYPRREQPNFRGRDQRPETNRPPRRADNPQRPPQRTERRQSTFAAGSDSRVRPQAAAPQRSKPAQRAAAPRRAERPRRAMPAPRVQQRAQQRSEPRRQPRVQQRAQPRRQERAKPRAQPRVQPRVQQRAEPRPQQRAQARAQPRAQQRARQQQRQQAQSDHKQRKQQQQERGRGRGRHR